MKQGNKEKTHRNNLDYKSQSEDENNGILEI